jgi:hypothetical protein
LSERVLADANNGKSKRRSEIASNMNDRERERDKSKSMIEQLSSGVGMGEVRKGMGIGPVVFHPNVVDLMDMLNLAIAE